MEFEKIDFLGFDLFEYLNLFDIIDSPKTIQNKKNNSYIKVVHSEPIFRDVCFDFKRDINFEDCDPIARFYINLEFLDLKKEQQNRLLSIVIYKTLIKEFSILYSWKEIDSILMAKYNVDRHFFIENLDSLFGDEPTNISTNVNHFKGRNILKYLFK